MSAWTTGGYAPVPPSQVIVEMTDLHGEAHFVGPFPDEEAATVWCEANDLDDGMRFDIRTLSDPAPVGLPTTDEPTCEHGEPPRCTFCGGFESQHRPPGPDYGHRFIAPALPGADEPTCEPQKLCEHGWNRAHNELVGPGQLTKVPCPGPTDDERPATGAQR